jgi:beta-glucosidase
VNSAIAHAKGYHIIKGFGNTPVSTAHALQCCVPENPFDEFDVQASKLIDWQENEFFFHAIRTGELVFPFHDAIEVPELKGALDYWAVNYYCRKTISARKANFKGIWNPVSRLKMIDQDFYLEDFYPEGLTNGLMRLKDFPVYITENGCCCDDDRWRIVKLALDLKAIKTAIDKGVDVRGYLHWSLMDNYEWASFVPRFGLIDVDFNSFKRTPKASAFFFRDIIDNNGFDGSLVKKYLPELPEFKLYP